MVANCSAGEDGAVVEATVFAAGRTDFDPDVAAGAGEEAGSAHCGRCTVVVGLEVVNLMEAAVYIF